MEIVTNTLSNKQITLYTAGHKYRHRSFNAAVNPGPGPIKVESDLPGLLSKKS
jgi:hypothetical protein